MVTGINKYILPAIKNKILIQSFYCNRRTTGIDPFGFFSGNERVVTYVDVLKMRGLGP